MSKNTLCPNCEKDVEDDLFHYFMSGYSDYSTGFTYSCIHCGSPMRVEVESIPVFKVSAGDKP